MFTKENMGNAVGRLFIEKYFDEEAKENVSYNFLIKNKQNYSFVILNLKIINAYSKLTDF